MVSEGFVVQNRHKSLHRWIRQHQIRLDSLMNPNKEMVVRVNDDTLKLKQEVVSGRRDGEQNFRFEG